MIVYSEFGLENISLLCYGPDFLGFGNLSGTFTKFFQGDPVVIAPNPIRFDDLLLVNTFRWSCSVF